MTNLGRSYRLHTLLNSEKLKRQENLTHHLEPNSATQIPEQHSDQREKIVEYNKNYSAIRFLWKTWQSVLFCLAMRIIEESVNNSLRKTDMKKKPFKITAEGLENLRVELAALPPKPKSEYSAREMLAEAEVEIRNALALGYDLHGIAELVGKHGGDINHGTLSAGLRELKAKPQGQTAKRRIKAGPVDAPPIVTPVTTGAPTSAPNELSPACADTHPDRQQGEAEFKRLLDQMKTDPES